MSKDACTPDNVIGALMGKGESLGWSSSEASLKELDKGGNQVYHEQVAKGQAEVLADANSGLAGKVIKHIEKETGDLNAIQKVHAGIAQTQRPSEIFPERFTEPVFKAIDDFLVATENPMQDVSGFKKAMKKVTKEVEPMIEQMPITVRGEAKLWLKDLQNGHPFGTWQKGNILTQGINNVVANAIDLSGTIIAGNPFELMVKLPTVYGLRGSTKGIAEALKLTKGNFWGRIPELEKRGFYGFANPHHIEAGIQKNSKSLIGKAGSFYNKLNDSILNVTDRPLKNIAFAAGYEKTGTVAGGMEAVEKIAFLNRIGNDPRIARNAASKNALTFLNYTLNTYGLLGSYMKGLTNPKTAVDSARAIGTFAGMTMFLGGGAGALIPEPLAEVLTKYDPDFKEWQDENLSTIGKLVRPGGISSIGISSQMASRALKRFGTKMGDVAEALGEGELNTAALDMADAGLAFSSFWRSPFGNPRIQKVLRNARDLHEDEIDLEEFQQKTAEGFLPVLKEAK